MNAETQALLTALDAATTKVADKIKGLLAEINEDAMTPETKAGFADVLSRLEAMGTSPTIET